jgi:hypothetical protein
MSLLQSVFGLIKEPTSDRNRSEELIGDRRSMGYHLADNIFGFDDGYETKGEKAGTAVKEAITQAVTDPIGTGKAIATGMYDAIDKGMDGPIAFYEGPDYQVDFLGNPVGTEEEVAEVNQALAQAEQDYLMNNLDITAGVGAGGMTASKALMDVDPDAAYSGLFLNTRAARTSNPDFKKAWDLDKQGVDRDEIWEQTGWGKLFGEWVKETDDSLTYTKKMADTGVAAKNLGVPEAPTKKPEGSSVVTSAVSAKKRKEAEKEVKQVQLRYEDLLRIEKEKARKGEITQADLEAFVIDAKNQMASEVDTIRNRELSKFLKIAEPTVADPVDRNLKNDGLLTEVLGNRPKDLDDALNSPYRERSQFGGDAGAEARAESGVRQHGSYYGVYGQDQGKIKAFKRFGIGGANNPQDKKDILNLDMDQTAATAEWSTLLHETQHYLDDVFRSTSGRGSNTSETSDRKAIRAWAREKYNAEKAEIDKKFKKGSDEHTAAIEALDNTRHGKARKASTKGGYDNFAFYTRDAGETKARLVQARRSMSAAERRAEPPWKTMEKLFGENGKYPTTEDEVFRLSEYGDYYENSYMRPPKDAEATGNSTPSASFAGGLDSEGFTDPTDETLEALGKIYPDMEARSEVYRVGERENQRSSWSNTNPNKDVRIGPEKPLVEVPVRPASPERGTVQYDPDRATVEFTPDEVTLDSGEVVDLGRNRIVPTKGASTIEELVTPDENVIYRGMSAEEYRNAMDDGFIQSKGKYNIGDEQKGLTFFSFSPSQAQTYANDFTPAGFKATPDRPAYVVAIKLPDNDYPIGQVNGSEVGLKGAISTDEIVSVFEGRPYEFSADFEIGDDFGRTYMSGSGPTSRVTWEKLNTSSADSQMNELF